MSTSASDELTVTFFPQLFLQRRVAILSVLRRENISTILDVGCGEGALLAALSQPPPWLPEPIQSRAERDTMPVYPTLIEGLDVADLQFAIQSVEPSEEKRWCPLKVKLYQGSLQDFNPEFVGFECIVASEVIEHLPEDVMAQFAPMIMGVYRPRVLIITTPNYSFNARFTPPSVRSPTGFPDPTGRTDRVFRHGDHKFEWTEQEFNEWCNTQAAAYGYHVNVYSIGRANEKDPWGRDEGLGGASQVAEFILDQEKPRSCPIPSTNTTVHTLVAEFEHEVRPEAGKPSDLAEIGEAVRKVMEHYRETLTWLEQLWFEEEISFLCGGSFQALIDAVHGHPKLELVTNGKDRRSEWQVQLEEEILTPLPNAAPVEQELPVWGSEEPFEVPLDWEHGGTLEYDEIVEESSGWEDELDRRWHDPQGSTAGLTDQSDIAWGGDGWSKTGNN